MTPAPAMRPLTWTEAYRMRWKRRRLLWRSFRSRHRMRRVEDRTTMIRAGDILAVMVLRNEIARLPFFLEHYRRLGVGHFLVVDNGSDDGSAGLLAAQPDVSLWQTDASYRAARFGLDWMTWLQMRYAHGHWCLMVDADEILVFPEMEQGGLPGLTGELEATGRDAYGALMLDMYPRGALDAHSYVPGQDPAEILNWFDDGPWRAVRQYPLGNLWVQGGVRERVFFADDPRRSPTLNKLPLVKWDRRYAYVNSTHSMLPPRLNAAYDGPGGSTPAGVLLHSKFLPGIVSRSEIEQQRGEHFHTPASFDDYYARLMAAPDLWCDRSVCYTGVDDLERCGLVRRVRPAAGQNLSKI